MRCQIVLTPDRAVTDVPRGRVSWKCRPLFPCESLTTKMTQAPAFPGKGPIPCLRSLLASSRPPSHRTVLQWNQQTEDHASSLAQRGGFPSPQPIASQHPLRTRPRGKRQEARRTLRSRPGCQRPQGLKLRR